MENEDKMLYTDCESGKTGYAIAPIEELRVKYPADSCRDWAPSNCCATSAAAAAMDEIDRIISELTPWEKEQLLLMILQAGIPSKKPWNDKEGSSNV